MTKPATCGYCDGPLPCLTHSVGLPPTGPVSPHDVVSLITQARGSVYGSFSNNAAVAQSLKDALRSPPAHDWNSLDVRGGWT